MAELVTYTNHEKAAFHQKKQGGERVNGRTREENERRGIRGVVRDSIVVEVTKARGRAPVRGREDRVRGWGVIRTDLHPLGIRSTNPVVVAGAEVLYLGSSRTVCQATLQTLR